MKANEVENCSFVSWYPTYKPITIKSKALDASEELISYLNSEGVVLPQSCEIPQHQGHYEEDQAFDAETDWGTEDGAVAEAPSFPALDAAIKETIEELGGAVFPKLNWSSPKDASWISFNNSLKCTCPADVYLLLKSSEFISHDLSNPYEYCDDDPTKKGEKVKYFLVLRKWTDIHPASEFRCFVKNHDITGISQRHPRSYYPFIKQEKEDIIQDIVEFFSKYIQEKFPDTDYVIDIVRESKGQVMLLDFNPWGPVTDSLLYSWEELESKHPEDEEEPDFRYVESEKTISANPYNMYAMPKEMIDFTTQADTTALVEFVKLQIESQNDEADSEEEHS